MASAAHKIAGAPAAQAALPDELLEDIFVRLDAAEDLARAAAACTTFRRVVSGRRFLRRFRSLHPPPLLGFLDSDEPGEFHPADPPHRSAPAARALAQAADFTFSFLGNPNPWRVRDARDGRVLLSRGVRCTGALEGLVVCDPLHRRYVELPPIPDDLAAATGSWGVHNFDPFLDGSKEEEEEEDLSFRVICAAQCQQKLVTCHFSSVTGKWEGITFYRSRPLPSRMASHSEFFKRHYAHNCFFWTVDLIDCYMFMLDMHEMEFSTVNIPPPSRILVPRAIVEAGENRIALFYHSDPMMLDLYCKTLRNNGVDTEEWQHKRIPLPEIDCRWRMLGQAEGCLFLGATPQAQAQLSSNSCQQLVEVQYFTLDPKTLLFERLCVSNQRDVIPRGPLYASFPPPFSLPSI